MIHELLGAAGFIGGDRKISINGSFFEATITSPLPLSNITTTTATTTPPPPPPPPTATTTTNNNNNSSTSSNSENNQNLRCPRCDSSNTKFCYYNNYNLTQPRHFCKTCRRYWTKGGALRNVPIGGGCRKNKNSSSTVSAAASFGKSSPSSSSTASKLKTVAYAGLSNNGFDHHHHHHHHEFSSSPIMWNSAQNSQLLAIMRTPRNPNNDFNPAAAGSLLSTSPVRMKEDQGRVIGTHHVIKGEPVGKTAAVLNSGTTVLNSLSQQQVPSFGLCSPLWKTNQHQAKQYQQNGFLIGHEAQNPGAQELYQRLKSSSSTNYCYADYHHSTSPGLILSNAASGSSSSSSSATTILESAPIAGGELGYWNPVFSWPDLPTTNGSYP